MIKVYQVYLIKSFLNIFMFVFLHVAIVLNILKKFLFKNTNISLYPFYPLLNTSILLKLFRLFFLLPLIFFCKTLG